MRNRRLIMKSSASSLIFSSTSLSLSPAQDSTGTITITTSDGSQPTGLIYSNSLTGCTYTVQSNSNNIVITFKSTGSNTSTSNTKNLGYLEVNGTKLNIVQTRDYVIYSGWYGDESLDQSSAYIVSVNNITSKGQAVYGDTCSFSMQVSFTLYVNGKTFESYASGNVIYPNTYYSNYEVYSISNTPDHYKEGSVNFSLTFYSYGLSLTASFSGNLSKDSYGYLHGTMNYSCSYKSGTLTV